MPATTFEAAAVELAAGVDWLEPDAAPPEEVDELDELPQPATASPSATTNAAPSTRERLTRRRSSTVTIKDIEILLLVP